MTCTIGRCSLPDDPFDLMVDGDRLSFTVDLIGSSVDHLKALRQQLLGLVDNPDEPVVSFTWSEDPSFDGWYRVRSVSVDSTEVMLSTGTVPRGVKVSLEQIPGFANPWFEVMSRSVVRTNGHGVTAPKGIWASYAVDPTSTRQAVDLQPLIAFAAAGTSSTLTTDGGTVTVIRDTSPLPRTSYRFLYTAAAAYIGAARIEVLYGSSWYQVIGRQVPPRSVWRITNGFVRLTSANGATPGMIEVWNGSAWESINIVHHSATSPAAAPFGIGLGDGTAQASLTIVQNSPEEVRVSCEATNTAPIKILYRVQRGARHVAWSWKSPSTTVAGSFRKYGLGFDSTHAAAVTAFTGGVANTANDVNGNRVVFGTAEAFSTDLVTGRVFLTLQSNTSSGYVGVDLNGAGVTTAIRDEFLGATAMRQRVIVR